MKISLRILMQEDAVDLLRGTDIFSEDELASVAFDIDSQSEQFARFVRVAKDASGTWFNPIVTFTKKELESAAYFEPSAARHSRNRIKTTIGTTTTLNPSTSSILLQE